MAEILANTAVSMASPSLEIYNSGEILSFASNNMTQQEIKVQSTVKEMLFTMRLVSFICNFWTLALSLMVIYQLGQKIHYAKKKRDLKRKPLYLASILFVSVILVLSIIN